MYFAGFYPVNMQYLLSISLKKSFPNDLKQYVTHYLDRSFSPVIIKRAKSYYTDNLVNVEAITFGEILGQAEGNRMYNLSLKREDNQVYMSCDCPYEGPCKHLVAFLRLLADEPDEELLLFTDEATEDYFQGYLKGLNKTELVNLVQRFATPEFRTEVRLTDASPQQRDAAYKRAEQKFNVAVFGGEYHYERFEPEVNEALLQLEPFINTHPTELLEVLTEILTGIQGLFEENQLYDYNYDPIYSGKYLCGFAAQLILSRPPNERRNYFLTLWEVGTDWEVSFSFDRLPLELIEIEDQLQHDGLSEILLSEEIMFELEDYHQVKLLEHFKSNMTKEEYLAILREYGTNSASFAILNAKFFLEERNDILAAGILEEFIAKNPKGRKLGEVYHLRCEIALAYEEEKKVNKWLKRYLKADSKAKTLQFAVEQRPQRATKFENILRKSSAFALATYLEEKDRPDEVVALHEAYPAQFKWHRGIFDFHQRYPGRYPKQGAAAAHRVLEENLGETGNSYYENVVSALLMLQLITPPDAMETKVQKIVSENKRKRNLIKLLGEAGLWPF